MARQVLTIPDVPPTLLQKATADATYATVGHLHTGTYLPLTGGTLTGPLTGTSITASGVTASGDIAAQHLVSQGADAGFFLKDRNTANQYIFTSVNDQLNWYSSVAGVNQFVMKGGNIAVGPSAPAAWAGTWRALQVGDVTSLVGVAPYTVLGNNTYFDGTNNRALTAGASGKVVLASGTTTIDTAPSVAAGAAQTFTTRLTLNAAGNLGLATAPSAWGPTYRALQVGDAGAVWAASASGNFMNLSANTYYDGTNRRAINTAAASEMSLAAGALTVTTAPSVAAGAVQTHTTRLTVSNNGTVTLAPDTGQAALSCNWPGIGLSLEPGVGNNARVRSAYQLELAAGANGVQPVSDNLTNMGWPDKRWTAVWAVNPAIQTSHVTLKHGFARLDPASCAAAVVETDWLSFAYNDPVLPDRDGEDDETWAAKVGGHQTLLADTAISRQQKGYVLGSDEYHTADLFGQPDRYSASTHADLAVVACALQDALKRIAQLEAAR